MDARSELLAYLGSTIVTVATLFGLQHWYATYLDVHVIHAAQYDVPRDAKVEAQRTAEAAKLSGGALPIDKAMAAIAERGRTAFPKIAPKPSEDLSPMSGWMHRPNFKPYEPRRPAAALATPAQGDAAQAQAEGAAEGGDAAAEAGGAAPAEGEAAAAAAPAAPAGAPN